MDTCIVTVKIIKKETKKTIQMIHFGSGWLFDDAYNKCSDVRSYITGYNKKAMVQDSDFGSIIVADFNFDGKEDIFYEFPFLVLQIKTISWAAVST